MSIHSTRDSTRKSIIFVTPSISVVLVRMRGLEPPRHCWHMNLNHARLPVPPHPHFQNRNQSTTLHIFDQRYTADSEGFCRPLNLAPESIQRLPPIPLGTYCHVLTAERFPQSPLICPHYLITHAQRYPLCYPHKACGLVLSTFKIRSRLEHLINFSLRRTRRAKILGISYPIMTEIP